MIVGAGPGGAVAGYVLARFGHRVALIDRADVPEYKVGESLPGAIRRLLSHLELSSLLDEEDRHQTSLGNVSSWGSDELEAKDFIDDPDGLSWHLDRPQFERDLRRQALDSGCVWFSASVRSVEREGQEMKVSLPDRELRAKYVIDATGRPASIALRLGAERELDDELIALCAWVEKLEGDQDLRTLLEAVPDGWWYTASVPGGHRVVVLHVNGDKAAGILRTDGEWTRRLRETNFVSDVVGDAKMILGPYGKEACGSVLSPFFGQGWVAVGDAAMAFDPLSSQGMFNAIYSGMKAAQAIDGTLAGKGGLFEEYAERLRSIRKTYLARHRLVYATEQRFSQHDFWRQRH